jgi:transposase
MERMRSVPGVGPVVAGAFRLEVFAPERFRRAEEVASLGGPGSTVHQSGDGKPRGWLPKAGNKLLRSLMIEAAWRWRAMDPRAREYYARILSRTGLPQKAIAALARKLVVLLWRLSVGTRQYQQAT